MGLLFTVTVPDEPAVVRDRLAAALTKKAPGWFSSVHSSFRGLVTDNSFRVTRNFAHGERSMPIVAEGRFAPAVGGGTSVVVTTRLDPLSRLIVVIVGLWSMGWLIRCGDLLFVNPRPDGIHRGEIALCAGLAAFGCAIQFIGLAYERDMNRQGLLRILAPGTDSFKLPA